MAIVYLDVDDEITSAAARIRSAEDVDVALVLPAGLADRHSRINFRLLAREAAGRSRRLAIVAPEASTRALAASAGLPVFASVVEYEQARRAGGERGPRGGRGGDLRDQAASAGADGPACGRGRRGRRGGQSRCCLRRSVNGGPGTAPARAVRVGRRWRTPAGGDRGVDRARCGHRRTSAAPAALAARAGGAARAPAPRPGRRRPPATCSCRRRR